MEFDILTQKMFESLVNTEGFQTRDSDVVVCKSFENLNEKLNSSCGLSQ